MNENIIIQRILKPWIHIGEKFIEAEAKLNKTSNGTVGKANCFHELSLQTVTRIKPIFF